MLTIWKWPVVLDDGFTAAMPKGAVVLSLGVQNELPSMWALVDSAQPLEQRSFLLRGTGHDASGCVGQRFIGTFQLLGGGLVFHLFEINAKETK